MADPDPIGVDVRAAHARRRMPAGAACVVCGEKNPAVLKPGKAGVLERDHPGGRDNDPDLTVVLCLNHHRLSTNGQLAVGVELGENPARSMPERLESVLRGLAAFFAMLGESLMDWAGRLGALVAALDANCPAWRGLEASMS